MVSSLDYDSSRTLLDESLNELHALLMTTATVESMLHDVAVLAARGIGQDTSCGVTMQISNRTTTVASSDPRAAQLDEVQYGKDEGPCLEAMRTREVREVSDFALETRWESYPLVAQSYGCRSLLSLPLVVQDRAIGALNLYASEPDAFGTDERTAAAHFTARAEVTIAAALRFTDQVELSEQLRAALSSRAVIDQAIGIVMGQRRCSASEAFDVLRRASQNRNVKLRVVATDLTASVGGVRPQPRPPSS